MTKVSSVLQNKLQQLENELINEVFPLPLEPHQLSEMYILDVEQRFLFLKNLLSAERSSSPKTPRHLQHIEKRISDLETAFYDWIKNKCLIQDQLENLVATCSCTESSLDGDYDGDKTSVQTDPGKIFEEAENVFVGSDETGTQDQFVKCSCTEPCPGYGDQTCIQTGLAEVDETENVAEGLNETLVQEQLENETPNDGYDGDRILVETGSDKFEEAERVSKRCFTEEKKTPGSLMEIVFEEKRELKRSGRFCWGLASGVVIGMALMGFLTVRFSAFFPYLEHNVYLPPT